MTKTVTKAIEEISNLPEADQETIGRSLLSYIERLSRLRAEIDKGIRSLDAGKRRELNMEELIRSLHQKYGRA